MNMILLIKKEKGSMSLLSKISDLLNLLNLFKLFIWCHSLVKGIYFFLCHYSYKNWSTLII